MKRKICLPCFFILLTLLLAGCNLNSLKQYVPFTPTPTEKAQRLTATPSPTPRAEGTSVSVASNKRARAEAVVCTGWEQGALNVRTCPGVQCWAFFVLAEGRRVTLDGQTSQAGDGATWAHIIQPVDGWVNGKYLCEVAP